MLPDATDAKLALSFEVANPAFKKTCSPPGSRGTFPASSKIVGIDLGTTNSLVAAVDAGIPYVIADAGQQRLTPSVVHVPSPGADPIVGHPANRVRAASGGDRVFREAVHRTAR